MTESATTATIRAWHTHMEQGALDWYDLAGELLDRLDKAEQRLGDAGELPDKWRGRAAALDLAGLEGCADELESILNQSGSETSR